VFESDVVHVIPNSYRSLLLGTGQTRSNCENNGPVEENMQKVGGMMTVADLVGHAVLTRHKFVID